MKKYLIVWFIFNIVWSLDYETDIQPIFNANCMGCHAGSYAGGLQLGSYSELMSGGNHGNSVIPYDSENSILYQKISGNQTFGNQMPPSNLMYQTSIDLIAQWIDNGALESNDSLNVNNFNISPNFILNESYPNPFNPQTNISFKLTEATYIRLIVYNNIGKKIIILTEGLENAGNHSIIWDAINFPSGVYFIKLETAEHIDTQKILLVK
tara:strand:+ start:1175 stop:1804 length:630 start_codon:yes stop_codon:yes gene_type:complete